MSTANEQEANERESAEEKDEKETSSSNKDHGDEKKSEEKNGKDEAKLKKKGSKKPLIILGIVLVIAAIVGVIYYLHARNYESTDDAFIDGNVVQVSPKVAGTVTAVHFTDNARVQKGQLLIEIDPRPYQVALEKARAQLAQAKAQSLQQGAQTEVAGINYDRNNGLYTKDARAVSKEQVDSAKANLDAAKGALGAAQATIQAANASVHDAELQLSYTQIHAVSDGKIARKQVVAGNFAQPGQTLCSLVQPAVWVTANYKETQLAKMVRGQPVQIEVDIFPDRKLKGHVDSFQPGTGSRFSLLPAENATGNFVKVVQRVPVKIVFDEPRKDLERLSPGQSVIPTVDIRVRPNEQRKREDR